MRALSRSVALLDGREQTIDNLRDNLPALIEGAGFSVVASGCCDRTIYGAIGAARCAAPQLIPRPSA